MKYKHTLFVFIISVFFFFLCNCSFPSLIPDVKTHQSNSLTVVEDKSNAKDSTDAVELSREQLAEMRIRALQKEYPNDDYYSQMFNILFPDDSFHIDKTAHELSNYLCKAKIGTRYGDINFSDEANFKSVLDLDKNLLFYCSLANSKHFKWPPSENTFVTPSELDDPYYLKDYSAFFDYTDGNTCGYFKEDIEHQACFYFGKEAKVDFYAYTVGITYHEYAGVYTHRHAGVMPRSFPFVLSYKERGNGYEAVFTSMVLSWNGNGYVNPDLNMEPVEPEQEMPTAEAVQWYQEHGAQAKVVLEEQEDGRLIVKSLEILRGYDTLEDIEMQKAYGK